MSDSHEDHPSEQGSAPTGPSGRHAETASMLTDELAALLPELMFIARSFAPQGIDPEDLLADAMMRLLARQQQEPFELEHPKAYLAATMRNLVLDFHRSPRSRVDTHDDTFFHAHEDESPVGTHRVRAAELHREFEVIASAFAQLPPETRMLLEELLLKGRAPSELGEKLGIGASAVALRLFRAKAALKREVLVQHLHRGSEECRVNAERIAAPVELEPELHTPKQRGMRHVLECTQCRRNWAGFAAMAQALGIVPLLVLVNSGQVPAAALAAGDGAANDAHGDPAAGAQADVAWNGSDGVGGAESATPSGVGGAGGAGGSASGGAGGAGSAAGTAGGAAGGAAGMASAVSGIAGAAAATGAVAGGGIGGAAATSTGAASAAGIAAGGGIVAATVAAAGFGALVLRVLTSRVTTMVWAGSLVVGGGVAVTHFAADQAEALPTTGERRVLAVDEQLDARFTASADWLPAAASTGDRAEFSLGFNIADVSGWQVEELLVALPVGSALMISAPSECAADGELIRCVGLEANWAGDRFEVALAAADADGLRPGPQRQFAAWITVTTDHEIELNGTAERVLEETSLQR